MSDATPPPAKAKRGGFFSREKKEKVAASAPARGNHAKKNGPRKPSTTYSFTNGDDDDLSTLPDSSPQHAAPHHRPSPHDHRRYSAAPASSPQYKARAYRDHDAYSEAPPSTSGYFTEDGDVGTKSYTHHIPGLSRPAQTEASFDRGERRGKAGYRRGEGRRRDSLSDSDG